MAASGGTKAVVAALVANLGIAIAKFTGFVITGASSMLSEAIHSVADTGNQALLLLGGRRARRHASEDHPFGYGRERYFWAFVVAVVLFTLGSLFAIYEGVHKIRHPEPIDSPAVAISILVVAIVLEGFSFRTAVMESTRAKGKMGWWRFLRTAKAPELPVVLLEDAGAMVGLVVALGAISTSIATGNGVWDGIGSVLIGVVLGVIAVFLCVEMKSLLIGESADPAVRDRIRALIEATPGVRRLIHERTQHLGPEEILLAVKVEFDPGMDLAEIAAGVDSIEASVRTEVPEVGPIYVEPDLYRTVPVGGRPEHPDAGGHRSHH
jgi:cation diffusion facilitator family transporter